MQIETVTSTDGLVRLRPEWERLEREGGRVPYYVHHRFVAAWWDAYADHPDIDLHLVTIRQNNTLVCIAPLSIRLETRGGTPVDVLRFASHGDYLDVLVDPTASVNVDTVLKELMRFLAREAHWDRVSLRNVPATSPLAAYLLKSSTYNDRFRFYMENPYLDLTAFRDFDAYEAHVSPTNARKYRNKLFRERDVEFAVVPRNEDGILDAIAALHRAEKAWLVEHKGREERHSLYEDTRRARHIANVFDRTDDALTFCYRAPDGTLIGYRTCFLHDDALLSWNSAYDPAFHEYRIGKALQYDLLRHAFTHRLADRFDFGAGRYPWKFEWTDTFTATYRLQISEVDRHEDDDTPARRLRSVATAAAEAQPAATPPAGSAPEPTDSAGSAGERAAPERTPPGPAPGGSPSTDRDPATTSLVVGLRGVRRRAGRLTRRIRRSTKVRRLLATLLRTAGRAVGGARAGAAGRQPGATHLWYVPHPDDEALYMAGSMAQPGTRRNVVVLLTRGGASSAIRKINARVDTPLTPDDFMDARLREFRASLDALGVDRTDVVVHDLPDGGLQSVAVGEIVRNMERQYPGAVHHTMSFLDPHPDHAAAGRAVRDACREGHIGDCMFHLPIPVVDDTLGDVVTLADEARRAKAASLAAYEEWDPANGRYAVGTYSVASLLSRQRERPTERTHGVDGPTGVQPDAAPTGN